MFLGHFLIIISWTRGFFPKICNLTPLKLSTKEYFALVHPYIYYANLAWAKHKQNLSKKN